MHDLRVVLHTGHVPIRILERSDRGTGRTARHHEALGGLGHGITVAHPYVIHSTVVQEATIADDGHRRPAIFTVPRARDNSA